jgi:2-methylisocitrate lyase-like PEP mutase family enzyme
MGFSVAAYPLTLMSAAMRAMLEALAALKGQSHPQGLLDFADLRARVGFENYYAEEARYTGARS